ncbi:MAG: histidinol dehydrogenase [Acidimicrobiales bacterium]|nr:histidinol dehydrogenase [Hyphomonadaceae bacterium]RZV41781.1 MAG: histidinol dehydrogenase [Acidimicrobiales bacterium]
MVNWSDCDKGERANVLARPEILSDAKILRNVDNILGMVRDSGDAALLDLTLKFDGIVLSSLRVPISESEAAWSGLDLLDQQAMQTAKTNIEAFHLPQKPKPLNVETMPGVVCRREPRALDSAGLYVPAGTAPLVSTLMMLAIPAKLAGVPRCVVTTPPGKDGKIDKHVLAAAHLCGVDEVYCVGGAQAIAALAFGTESIAKVAKIFGPGNAYVSTAKARVAQMAGGPAIDLPAGPSEAMVLADDQADPVFVASDLLSQAEHDTMAQVVCVCRSQKFAQCLTDEINNQLTDLPRRNIAEASLENGRIIVVNDRNTMIEIANTYAAEHLIVQIDKPESAVPHIQNAGSVFLGPWTPESVGDYASGTNHTLPTNGAARAYSGVVLESFIKYISVQQLSRAGLEALGPSVERLANMEGLEAHRRAVSLRLERGEQ